MKKQTYAHIGKRANQEDALNHSDTAFVVCDGVGGHTKGEVASNFVATKVLEVIDTSTLNSPDTIQDGLKAIQQELNETLDKTPEAEGMGTTFCGVFKTKETLYIAHIGDSRVYYIKPKQQLFWHTWDHSLVSYLVQTNEITREDARFHPQNNRISRAITAKTNNKIAKADITTLTNLEKGDILFICSDGINEAWSDLELVDLLMSNKSIKEKLSSIQKKCALESKDNNTAILLEVESEDELLGDANTIEMLPFKVLVDDNNLYLSKNENINVNAIDEDKNEAEAINNNENIEIINKPKKKKWYSFFKLLVLLFILLGVCQTGVYLYNNYIIKENSSPSVNQNTVAPVKINTTLTPNKIVIKPTKKPKKEVVR